MSTLKLNQAIAAETHRKNELERRLTDSYKLLQKGELFNGHARSYRPRDDEGVQLPDENQHVQLKATDVLKGIEETMTELFDMVATKDFGNQLAKADIIVGGRKLAADVPVPYLLFLEKRLTDLHTVIKTIPTHDASRKWEFDESADLYRSDASETTKTQRVLRNHVKAEATDRHPAQVDTYTEDIVIGYWNTVRLSGALPAARVRELADRVQELITAVKHARETANSVEIQWKYIGASLFNFLLAD